jgi:hypothetical protein
MRANWTIGSGVAVLLAAMTAACSSPSTSAPGEVSEGVATGATYAFVQRVDTGYSITELNTSSRPEVVTAINFDNAGVDASDLASELAVPRTIAALGQVQGDTFVASAVYQALPGVAPAASDLFYLARTQRDGDVASAANLGEEWMLGRVDVSVLSTSPAERTCLQTHVLAGSAIVVGPLVGPLDGLVLDARQVLVQLPGDACATD